MALVLAMMVAGTLFALGSSKRFRPSAARAATAVLLLAAVLAASLVPSSWAQDGAGAGSQALGAEMSVSRDGIDPGVTDLLSSATLGLRLTYWKVALIMAKDNFWTGVGLGNFGTVYAKYQYIGAGGVQAAHNDYLQILCETGIFGFLAFCGFWAYFCIWGALRILRETEAPNRGLLCGLYGGVLAFLLHSLVDFNFYNPALVFLVILMAGLFYARAAALDSHKPEGSPNKPVVYRIVALPILLAVAFVTTASLRVYIYDYTQTEGLYWQRIFNIGDRKPMRKRIQVAKYLLHDLVQQTGTPNNPPAILLSEVARLINVRKTIEEFGVIRVPVPGDPPSLRPLARGEVPPPETVVFIHDAERARQTAAKMSEIFLEQIKLANDIYPHSPQDALVLYEWYSMLQDQATDPGQKRKYVMECWRWAKAGVDRNPEQAWFHQWYGKALLMRGTMEGGKSGVNYYRLSIAEYRKATDLYAIDPGMWFQYASILSQVGNAFVKAGRLDEGEKMIADGKKAQARADELVALTS